jgi:hypothetical protein
MYSKSDEKMKWKEEPKDEEKKNLKTLQMLEAQQHQTTTPPAPSEPPQELVEAAKEVFTPPTPQPQQPVVVDAQFPPVGLPIEVDKQTTSTLAPPATIQVPNDNTNK